MKNKVKYLILGAGPAGLTFGMRLKQKGEDSFLIIEKESTAGGLCRSKDVDGAALDIGGGHFLDVRRKDVNDFLFSFMPKEEWNQFDRDSRIKIGDTMVHHPIEANIWEMQMEDQIEYLQSIAAAGCNTGMEMPVDFIDWIYWKLGKKIAEDYMIPYNQKMFGSNLNMLGIYWLSKLPDVSFEDTLRSCIEKRAYAKQPGHAQFFYPKQFGYGEVWRRMSEVISEHIVYQESVEEIDFESKTVKTTNGSSYQAESVITTIPWMEFKVLKGMPEKIRQSISDLKYSSVQVEYFPETLKTEAQWIYYPAEELPYHRILVRHNFCSNSKGYWTETNADRVVANLQGKNFKYINQYAYPLNTISKPQIMDKIIKYSNSKNVFALGRWGEHRHYNSDAVVELSMSMADKMLGIY